MELKTSKISWIFVLLFLAAPLYVWRFSVGVGGMNAPTNFLMLASFIVILIGFVEVLRRGQLRELLASVRNLPKPLLIGVGLIIVASVISLIAFGVSVEKLAQWLVLYAQPITIFFLLNYFVKSELKSEIYNTSLGNLSAHHGILRKFYLTAYLFLFVAGALAILQYFTLWALPVDWLGNSNEPKRAIAFFAHPNAFALYITPLLAWLIPDVARRIMVLWNIFDSSKSWMQQAGLIIRERLVVMAWLVGAFGLLLSLSRGAWLGLLVAAGVYALLSANKKILLTFFGCAIILVGVVFAVPNLRWRVLLPFHGEKSSVARISLWDTATKMISDGPILGKGMTGFASNWDKYNTDPNLDHYNFPHNILLNFWVDLGLLGVAGFAIVIGWSIWQGIIHRKKAIALGLLLFMVALVVHGLIDIPYLKNDLALIFWMILAVSI